MADGWIPLKKNLWQSSQRSVSIMASLVLKKSCVIFLLTCAIWISGGQSCCPQYWTQVGSYCYRYFGSPTTWHNANYHCLLLGAHQPSIHNRAEEAALYRLWKGLARNPTQYEDAYWIGLRDTYREGHFTWTDGTITDYTNWQTGEPNDNNGEDCVEVRNQGVHDEQKMEWNDISCAQRSRSFFCRTSL